MWYQMCSTFPLQKIMQFHKQKVTQAQQDYEEAKKTM